MSDFSTARTDLAEALEGNGYIVYAYPTETMQVPSIVLVPDNPYLEVNTISAKVFAQNFKATLMVAYIDNQASLLNLENLIDKFLDALPEHAQNATLDVELYQDWGSTSPASVCEALWTAAKSYPDTKHQAVLTAGGKTFTMDVYPAAPPVGGGANDVLTSSVSFVVDKGSITVA